ncbi:hypothetical protein [Streptomyces sp. CB02400]|nr:hypothetical protein [Streptomyces sp. CB02400]
MDSEGISTLVAAGVAVIGIPMALDAVRAGDTPRVLVTLRPTIRSP